MECCLGSLRHPSFFRLACVIQFFISYVRWSASDLYAYEWGNYMLWSWCIAYCTKVCITLPPQEDWLKEGMVAFCSEVQDKPLLMNIEYKIQGQVHLGVNVHVCSDNELLVDCQVTFTCYICEAYMFVTIWCVFSPMFSYLQHRLYRLCNRLYRLRNMPPVSTNNHWFIHTLECTYIQ